MKRLLFTGIKGGTGKSYLAAKTAMYLYAKLKKKVWVVGIDRLKILTAMTKLSCPSSLRVIETTLEALPIIDIQAKKENVDYIIYDINWIWEDVFFEVLKFQNKIIIPFAYNYMDLGMLLPLKYSMEIEKIEMGKICLVPNKCKMPFLKSIQKEIIQCFGNNAVYPSVSYIHSNDYLFYIDYKIIASLNNLINKLI